MRMHHLLTMVLFLQVVLVMPARAQDMYTEAAKVAPAAAANSQTEAAVPAEEEKPAPFEISGFVDAYYQYNFNDSPFPTSFTDADKSFSLGMANLVFSREGKVGFMADIAFGPRAEAANGYVNEDGSISSLTLIKQLFLTYSPSEKITFTLGNFSTHVGYEVIDAPGNINYSTSYMFSNGPFYHTGVKADVALSENFGLMLGVFNDTDTKIDVVKGKHIGAQLSFEKGNFSGFLNYLGGRQAEETDFSPELIGHQVDLTATFQATDAFGLGLNTTLRTLVPETGDNVSWFGAALYGNYAFSELFTLGVRGEYIGDKDGLITGLSDNSLLAFTISGNFHIGPLTLIPEFRFDSGAEEGTFADLSSGKPLKSTSGVLLAAVYAF